MVYTSADIQWINNCNKILTNNNIVNTRNHDVYKDFVQHYEFSMFPLITRKKVAVNKALRELEWFMSGDSTCPKELRDWWANQLSDYNQYVYGYAYQFRNIPSHDQIANTLNGLQKHPNSRRHILTAWNPFDMKHITYSNSNNATPTTCHTTMNQYSVRGKYLDCYTFQRSADMVLGLPHNFVQQWALLKYFATHAGLVDGKLYYTVGDAHIYNDESHLKIIDECYIDKTKEDEVYFNLRYNFSNNYDSDGVPVFKASDFKVLGEIPEPKTSIRGKLF
jgi:thymidylate synthase